MSGCLGDKLPERWWRDEASLRAELAAHGTLANAARAHGVKPGNVNKGWGEVVGDPLPRGPRSALQPVREPEPDESDAWLIEALKKRGDQATVEELADHADVAPRKVRDALERLGHAGYRVEAAEEQVRLDRAPSVTGERFKASPALFEGDTVRFAVVSDVHTSSDAERVDELHAAYDVLVKEGISEVLNPGDLCDGMGIYKGQINEVKYHTYEAQVDHAAEVYPQRDGVLTKIIGGNHDLEGDFGKVGADPVQAVCNRRDDIEYLGRYSAWLDLPNGGSIHMLHPMGGASYAMSYRPQKIVESYEGGDKPSLLILGHWHRMGFFSVRGVQTLLAGTFQGPTTYSTRKAFGAPGFGFWIVEATMAEDGSLVRFKPEFLPFYANREVRASKRRRERQAA